MPSANAIFRSKARKQEILVRFRAWAVSKPECADIAVLLPEIACDAVVTAVKQREGSVYLIKSGEFYKIGRSDEIERRVKEIRIALPEQATLVHTIRTDDATGIEAYWHRRFADARANGEWFKLTQGDVAAFKKRRFQ